MELLDENIRKDVVKKYGQYTKRVNGQMIKVMYEWFERANRRNETNSSKHFRLEINRNTFEKYQQQIPHFHGIDFAKFSDLLVPLITGHFIDHQLKEIFEKLDSNHDEYLNRNEFEDLLRLIGRSESIDQIKKYISLLTTNEKLHFQDFKLFVGNGYARELLMS